jgi:hypothetical protein
MSTPTTNVPRLDSRLLKFSQFWTVLLSGLAFILQQPILTLIGAAALTISAIAPQVSPFRLLYRGVVVPLHLLRPRIVEDDPAPHRFAQGVGAVFLIAASIVLFLTHLTPIGWALDLIVFALAGINFTIGFCTGCFVYYHLGRMGITPRVRYSGSFHWRGA